MLAIGAGFVLARRRFAAVVDVRSQARARAEALLDATPPAGSVAVVAGEAGR